MVPSGRRYLPGTMVLETTWGTPAGWAVVRDVLLVGPWRHDAARSETHRRVPVDHSADRVLLRTVRCLQGSIDFVLECEPAFDYGRQRGTWRHTGSGYGQAEVSAGEAGQLLLTTDLNVGFEGPRAIARRRRRRCRRRRGGRNYDYRYTWLRDSTFMLWGLYTLGLDREASALDGAGHRR